MIELMPGHIQYVDLHIGPVTRAVYVIPQTLSPVL